MRWKTTRCVGSPRAGVVTQLVVQYSGTDYSYFGLYFRSFIVSGYQWTFFYRYVWLQQANFLYIWCLLQVFGWLSYVVPSLRYALSYMSCSLSLFLAKGRTVSASNFLVMQQNFYIHRNLDSHPLKMYVLLAGLQRLNQSR